MRQPSLQMVVAIAGIAGIVALFLPFTGDISPITATFDGIIWGPAIWRLALPFFLTIPILVTSIRLAMTNSLSKLESVIAYILGGAAIGNLVSWFAVGVANDPDAGPFAWLGLAIIITPLLLGIALLVRDLRTKRLQGYRPVLALQVAYVGNTIFCLAGFASAPGWQAGAYLSVVTAIAYLLQIGLAYSQSRQSPAPG